MCIYWLKGGYLGFSALLVLFFRKRLIYFALGFLLGFVVLPSDDPPKTREFFVREVLPRNRIGQVSLMLEPSTLCKAKDLPWVSASKAKPGDFLIAEVKARRVEFTLSPFSYETSLLFKGVNNECKIIFSSLIDGKRKSWLESFKYKIRKSLEDNIRDQEVRAVMSGMTFGDISSLSRQIEETFKKTGLYHLLIVSGYQVMVLFFLFRWVSFGLLSKNCIDSGRGEIITNFLSLIFCFNYGLLCGIEPPIKRALTFLVILVICKAGSIPLSSFRLILTTAILIIVIDPGSQFTPSFHLTFGALIGFMLSRKAVLGVIYASMLTSLISYLWFNELPLISVITNVFVAPLFTFLSLLGGLAGIISVGFGGFEPMFFWIEKATQALLWLLKMLPISGGSFLFFPYAIILLWAATKEFKRNALESYLSKIFRVRTSLVSADTKWYSQ